MIPEVLKINYSEMSEALVLLKKHAFSGIKEPDGSGLLVPLHVDDVNLPTNPKTHK